MGTTSFIGLTMGCNFGGPFRSSFFSLAHWAGRWSKQRDGKGEDIGSELELGLFVVCSSDTVGMGIPVFPPNP